MLWGNSGFRGIFGYQLEHCPSLKNAGTLFQRSQASGFLIRMRMPSVAELTSFGEAVEKASKAVGLRRLELAARARSFVREFELEATKAGADEEDLDFMRRVLVSPDAYVVYHGGRTRDMTEDEVLVEMGGLANGLRAWLRERIRRRGERAEGAD
jgi:hypothetical protein